MFAARAAVSVFFFLRISAALSRPSPKFLEILVLSWAPHAWTSALRARTHFQVRRRGLRNISDACPLSFPFSVFPFRPVNLGLFGAPLQPPAPGKNSDIEAHFFFEKGAFSTKNSEIEAHVLFEKEAFSTKISEIEAHVFFWKGSIFDEN